VQHPSKHGGDSNLPMVDVIQPFGVVQVIVYSPVHTSSEGWETQCIPDTTGVASQLAPQLASVSSMISAAVGSGRQGCAREKTTSSGIWHSGSMSTIPVFVAVHPSSVVQVMVYSQ
jgi:galactose-1-phosphate uridylyltransferase